MSGHMTEKQIFDCAMGHVEESGSESCGCESCVSRVERAKNLVSGFRTRAFAPFDAFQPEVECIMKNERGTKKGNGTVYMFVGALSAACVIFAVLFSVWKKEPVQVKPLELNGSVIFAVGEAFLNGKQASAGDVAKMGDILEAKERSSVTVQFNDAAIVSLSEKSLLKISDLTMKDGKLNVLLEQSKGISFNKIRKGAADYSVKSGTVVAAVRGTTFTFSADAEKSRVNLLEGKVWLDTPVKSETSVILEPGSGATADSKGISKPAKLKDKDTRELEALNQIEFTDTSKPLQGQESVPADALKVLTGAGLSDKKAKTTLPDLERKLGPLSTITTYDRKIYIGSFKQHGGNMEITTVDGSVTIPTAKVQSVVPYESQKAENERIAKEKAVKEQDQKEARVKNIPNM